MLVFVGLKTHHHQRVRFRKKNEVPKDFFGKSTSNLGVGPTWGGMFTVGQCPPDLMALYLIAPMTTTEAIKHEPQREATEATAAPTPTDHSTAYPGGGASKKIMADTSQLFNQLDRADSTRTKRSTQNTEKSKPR